MAILETNFEANQKELETQGANGPSFFAEESTESLAEHGRHLALKIEADPDLSGMIQIGKSLYLLAEDIYRNTPTKKALFVLSEDKWVALTEPSDSIMRTPEMIDANPEHYAQLVGDLMTEWGMKKEE